MCFLLPWTYIIRRGTKRRNCPTGSLGENRYTSLEGERENKVVSWGNPRQYFNENISKFKNFLVRLKKYLHYSMRKEKKKEEKVFLATNIHKPPVASFWINLLKKSILHLRLVHLYYSLPWFFLRPYPFP